MIGRTAVVGVAAAILGAGAAARAQGPDLLVSTLFGGEVLRFDSAGAFVGLAAGAPELLFPGGFAFAADGSLLVGDEGAGSILRFNPATGAFVSVFVPSFTGGLDTPEGVEIGPDGNLYVANHFAIGEVLRFNGTTGAFMGQFAAGGGLSYPTDIVFRNGRLYVASGQTDQVLAFNGATGALIGTFATLPAQSFPSGLDFGPDGNLYVAGYFSNEVYRFNGQTGASLGVFVPASAGVFGPSDIDFGPDGHLYVASASTDDVLRFNGQTGALMGVFATGSGLISPWYLLFDAGQAPCYPDCDANGALNVNDYICFQTKFALGDPYADCDGNGVRNVNDYICFQTKFALGC